MAYFRTYTYSFTDTHEAHPAEWRVDILDDEANAGVVPIELIPSFESLVLERIETSDDKATSIIGRQAVLQYEYTGSPSEPEPQHFFDVDERRFRVEVYKNSSLYDVFYIKPDSCQYEYKAPPFTVTLTAVDGLSFTKGVTWDAYTDGTLQYRWMSLYEAIIDRGLMLVMDDGIEINVINTLRPENISGDSSFLNDLYVHSEMFIDFTKGPDDVYTVIDKILKQFYLRLFVSQNKIWIIRMPDLLQDAITAENYIDGILNNLTLQTIRRRVGPSRTINDATPIDSFANIIMFPAVKRAVFKVDYRAINRLGNFDWSSYGDFGAGNQFEFWPGIIAPDVQQHGTGTESDPYTAFMQYNSLAPGEDSMINFFGGVFTPPTTGSPRPGDIIQFSVRFKFRNVGAFKICITLAGATPAERLYLSSSGEWTNTVVAFIDFRRSGKKQEGSINVKSVPIPTNIGNTVLSSQLQLQTSIFTPTEVNTLDDPDTEQGVEIYPIRIGIIPMSSAGRQLTTVNNGRYSKVLDEAPFYFIDIGNNGIANTLGITNTGTPAQNWSAIGAPTDKQDVERYMADATIDQYAKSVYGWEGNLYSNTIEFWNILTFDQLPGRQFVQMTDRYIVNTCTHVTNLQEILPENGADTTYTEIDIEDSND